jgi:hypothetical protein
MLEIFPVVRGVVWGLANVYVTHCKVRERQAYNNRVSLDSEQICKTQRQSGILNINELR